MPVSRSILVHAGADVPVLEIWRNRGAGTVLFYPGTMLAPGHYSVLISELLKAGLAVAGLHLAGHGECRERNDFRFTDLLGQGLKAEAWLWQNGFGPVVIAGHSQGGILALAHAGESRTLKAAFAITAVFPDMKEAIGLTRFASLAPCRERLLSVFRSLAAVFPYLPIPLPFYLQLGKIMAGRKKPLYMGNAHGRMAYPAAFLVSLFEAAPKRKLYCPLALVSARDDALFHPEMIRHVFEAIQAPEKELIWLSSGGHMAPLNPSLAQHMARQIACRCSGLGQPLNLAK